MASNPGNEERSQLIDHSPEDIDSDSKFRKDTIKQFIGYGFATFGVLEVCFGMGFAQALDRSIPHSELNGLRYSFQLVVTLLAIAVTKSWDVRVSRDKAGWLAAVSCAIVLTSYAGYGQTYYLPLGMAAGTIRSLQLITIGAIECIFNRSMKRHHLIASCLCLLGLLLVLQPHLIFHDIKPPIVNSTGAFQSPCNRKEFDPNASGIYGPDNVTNVPLVVAERSTPHDLMVGYCLIVTELVAVVAMVFITRYKMDDVGILTISFWSSVVGVGGSFVLMGAMETPTFPQLPICIGFLAMHMMLSGTHTVFLVYAQQRISPTMFGLIATVEIPLSFVLQYTMFVGMYPGLANQLQMAGAAIVFVGNIFAPSYESVQYFRRVS